MRVRRSEGKAHTYCYVLKLTIAFSADLVGSPPQVSAAYFFLSGIRTEHLMRTRLLYFGKFDLRLFYCAAKGGASGRDDGHGRVEVECLLHNGGLHFGSMAGPVKTAIRQLPGERRPRRGGLQRSRRLLVPPSQGFRHPRLHLKYRRYRVGTTMVRPSSATPAPSFF